MVYFNIINSLNLCYFSYLFINKLALQHDIISSLFALQKYFVYEVDALGQYIFWSVFQKQKYT